MYGGQSARWDIGMNQPSGNGEGSGLTLRIKFRAESPEQFVDRYGADISAGGIFIRAKEPLAVGTQLGFVFALASGSAALEGSGTVVWVREVDPDRLGGGHPGMGIRFDRLSPESQSMLASLLAEKSKREREGGVLGSGGRITPPPPTPGLAEAPSGAAGAEAAAGARAPAGQVSGTDATARVTLNPITGQPLRSPWDSMAAPLPEAPAGAPSQPMAPAPSAAHTAASSAPTAPEPVRRVTSARPAEPARRVTPPIGSGPLRRPTSSLPVSDTGREDVPGGGLAAAVSSALSARADERTPDPARGPATRSRNLDSVKPRAPSPAPGEGEATQIARIPPDFFDEPPAHPPAAAPPVARESHSSADSRPTNPDLPVLRRPRPSPGRPAPTTSAELLAAQAALANEDRATEAAPVTPQPGFERAPFGLGVDSGPPPEAFPPHTEEPTAGEPFRRAPIGPPPLLFEEGPVPPAVPPERSAAKKWVFPGAAALALACSIVIYHFRPDATGSPPSAAPTAVAPAPAPATKPDETPPSPAAAPAAEPTAIPMPDEASAKPAAPVAAAAESPPAAVSKTTRTAAPSRKAAHRSAAVSARPSPPAAPATGDEPSEATPSAEPAPSAAEPAAAETAEEKRWLVVRSIPGGADVLIDGEVEGKTPFQRLILDPSRSYTVAVRKAGFEAQERTISGSDGWVKKGNVSTLVVSLKLARSKKAEAAEPVAAPTSDEAATPEPAPPAKDETTAPVVP